MVENKRVRENAVLQQGNGNGSPSCCFFRVTNVFLGWNWPKARRNKQKKGRNSRHWSVQKQSHVLEKAESSAKSELLMRAISLIHFEIDFPSGGYEALCMQRRVYCVSSFAANAKKHNSTIHLTLAQHTAESWPFSKMVPNQQKNLIQELSKFLFSPSLPPKTKKKRLANFPPLFSEATPGASGIRIQTPPKGRVSAELSVGLRHLVHWRTPILSPRVHGSAMRGMIQPPAIWVGSSLIRSFQKRETFNHGHW